jgi:hypothetical protein
MRTAMLIDCMAERDLVFHLSQVCTPGRLASDPLLDPHYDCLVGRTMSDEERSRAAERLRRSSRAD